MSDTAHTQLTSSASCPECGTRLASGACPSCALTQLLEGESGGGEEFSTAVPMDSENVEFGRYVLNRRKAVGGMGVVYVAEDKNLKRTVALKMIRGSSFANKAELARFTIEAEAAATLDHPNIVPIYEVGQQEGQPFFTMKLIEGESLAERLKREPDLSHREIATLLSRISRAVHHAHKHGVLHRDLKPGNILLDGKGTPWLTDFGLAKFAHAESSLTLTSDSIGTPDYMSPEIAGGKVKDASTASDVWALGVILWEMMFGVPPFRGSGTIETMRRIVENEPVKLRGVHVNEDLVTLAIRCMEKDPTRRLGSAEELADELERWLRGEPIKARRITGGEWLVKWTRRNPTLTALYAALAVGFVSSMIFWQRAESAVDSLTESNAQLERTLAIANEAKGNRLAVEARLQLSEDPTRALLLGVEAVESGERGRDGVFPETAESLTAVLQAVGGTDVSALKTPREDYNDGFIDRWLVENYAPRISADGRWLITLDYTDWEKTGVQAAIFDLEKVEANSPVVSWTIWEELGGRAIYCWLPDSRRVLSVDDSGAAKVWEPFSKADQSGEPPFQPAGTLVRDGFVAKHVRLITRDKNKIQRIAVVYAAGPTTIQPDGTEEEKETFLGWMDTDKDGQLPTADDVPLWELPWGYGVYSHFAVSPDGQWALLIGVQRAKETHLVRFKGRGGEVEVRPLPEGIALIEAPIFSKNENWLAFKVSGKKGRLYDLSSGLIEVAANSGRDIPEFDHSETNYIAFSADDRWVAAAGNTSEIRVVPTGPESGRSAISLRVSGDNVYVVRFSGDGQWLAAGSVDRAVTVWPMEEIDRAPEPLRFRGLQTPALDVHFSPDSQNLVATGLHCIHRLWKVGTGKAGTLPEILPGEKRTIHDMAISPDGKWIASARGVPDANVEGGWVKWTDTKRDGEYVLGVHADKATGVVFSPDGKWFASVGRDGFVNVWRCARIENAIVSGNDAPEPDFVLDTTDARLEFDRKLAFHPRGTLYATCGDGALFEWDLGDLNPDAKRKLHMIHTIRYLLPNLAISPNGKMLAVCRHGWDTVSKEGTTQKGNMVLLFDVSKPGPPVPLVELPASFLGEASVTFSPDNRWLATSGSGFSSNVWDLQAEDVEGSLIRSEVTAHRMTGLDFSPTGRWLALGGSDGRIHLWDWKNTGQIRTTATRSDITSLAWLDNDRFITGGKRGRIALWQTNVDELKKIARKIAGRELSNSERRRFRIED